MNLKRAAQLLEAYAVSLDAQWGIDKRTWPSLSTCSDEPRKLGLELTNVCCKTCRHLFADGHCSALKGELVFNIASTEGARLTSVEVWYEDKFFCSQYERNS